VPIGISSSGNFAKPPHSFLLVDLRAGSLDGASRDNRLNAVDDAAQIDVDDLVPSVDGVIADG
jgi:hypothetical protein